MKRHNDNSDWMARKMDRELRRLERAITALYFNARGEVQRKFNKFMAAFEPQNAIMREQLKNGEITPEQYQEWARLKILKKTAYTELIKSLTKTLVNTDVAAMAAVRGYLPYVIANSFNFVQSLGWKYADDSGFSVGTFQIYNANAVQALIKDNPRLLPVVDLPKDQQWNMDKINNEITQGIIQGKNMDEIATGLQNVTGMDETAAMRTARTAFTYAENMGRDESFKSLKAKGMPVKKRWSAILDERTRDTHRLLNGTYANEQGLFGEGILNVLLRCPADPRGEPQEIYNCRCREGIVFEDQIVDHSNDDDLYEQFMKEEDPVSYEALKDRNYFKEHRTKAYEYNKRW